MAVGGHPVRTEVSTNSEIHGRTGISVVLALACLRAGCSDALKFTRPAKTGASAALIYAPRDQLASAVPCLGSLNVNPPTCCAHLYAAPAHPTVTGHQLRLMHQRIIKA